jgi:hypothetical protein
LKNRHSLTPDGQFLNERYGDFVIVRLRQYSSVSKAFVTSISFMASSPTLRVTSPKPFHIPQRSALQPPPPLLLPACPHQYQKQTRAVVQPLPCHGGLRIEGVIAMEISIRPCRKYTVDSRLCSRCGWSYECPLLRVGSLRIGRPRSMSEMTILQ